MPPKNYQFPFSVHTKNGKEIKRYASHTYLEKFEWLVFSDARQGFFCKYCPFFVNDCMGGLQKNVPLSNLVTKPLCKYAKLLGKDGALTTHANNNYHKNSFLAAQDFIKIFNNVEKSVENQVNTARKNQTMENRERLKPIIKTVILCGHQNISLRGHRDDGKLTDSKKSLANEGNFRELLRFRIDAGDQVLKDHLENARSNATYISKTTQNELINSCGKAILTQIVERIKKRRIYTIIFDETTDLSHTSQLSLCIRYSTDEGANEAFIQFLDLFAEIKSTLRSEEINEQSVELSHNPPNESSKELKATGANIAKVATNAIKNINLDLKDCVGIGADTCIVNFSEVMGAVKIIQKEAINAVSIHCCNHVLNLSISKSSSVQAVRNAVGIMKNTIAFFTASSKRNVVLKECVRHQLSGLCETRWVERHDGVMQFRTGLPKIVLALDKISMWEDSHTASQALALRSSLCTTEILVAIVCLSDLLTCTLPLSKFFQSSSITLHTAQNLLNDTLQILNRKRKESEVKFASIYDEIQSLAEELDIDLKIPRIVGKQMHRANYPSNNPIDYYRLSVYIPLVENVTEDLKLRFSYNTISVYDLLVLCPDNLEFNNKNSQSISNLAKKYAYFFNEPVDYLERILAAEFELWKYKWEREPNIGPRTVLQLLKGSSQNIYPTIHFLLNVLVTLPVSIACAERSFSILRLIKSWLRTTMSEDRLNGLALLYMHRDVELNIDTIIDIYATTRKHRLELIV